MSSRGPVTPDLANLARGIRAGERAVIARAITLVESRRTDHQKAARRLVQDLLPATGKAVRVGITGVPGVGKSTTIDALGTFLTGKGHKVAVLAVDPSSARTGGSILADKTRMSRLSIDSNAFVRPSPASGTLGGVAAKTRESMLICEAAGYDVVLVETIGTGQSETMVADMTDFFLVLMLPGAGDELQGLKKGVVEIADMIAINKADGDNIKRAKAATAEYRAALHILTPRSTDLVAAGRDLFGADRQRHRRAMGHRARPPRTHDQIRRARRAPARAAGEMDVGDAGGSRVRAAAIGLRASRRSFRASRPRSPTGGCRRRSRSTRSRRRWGFDCSISFYDKRAQWQPQFSSPASARFRARRSIRPSRWSWRWRGGAIRSRMCAASRMSFTSATRRWTGSCPRCSRARNREVLLMFGLAGRTKHVRIETRARNACSRRLPDAGGHVPVSATIAPEAPATLPLRSSGQRLVLAAQAAGVPAALSRDAGRYLCNYLCWRAAEASGADAPRLTAFIHVPIVHRGHASQSRRAALTLDDLIRAGEAIVQAALTAAR